MVDILYDIQHPIAGRAVRRAVTEISRRYNIPINLEICEWTLIDDLKNRPDYDLVILHVGGEKGSAYRQATYCKKLSNAPIIAESSIFPSGRQEILQYFHYYVGSLVDPDSLEEILRKYRFIKS
jgi:hypothetical protein